MTQIRPMAALVVVALIGAGCSSGSAAENGSTANENATAQNTAVKFSECMRENGVKGFPDPDASGKLTVDGVLNGSSLNPNTAAWKQAIHACKELQPPGFTGHKASPEEQNVRLEFAQCMREHGVKDFPDPAAGEPLVDTNRIPSSARDGGMGILNAAMHECGDVYADRLGIK